MNTQTNETRIGMYSGAVPPKPKVKLRRARTLQPEPSFKSRTMHAGRFLIDADDFNDLLDVIGESTGEVQVTRTRHGLAYKFGEHDINIHEDTLTSERRIAVSIRFWRKGKPAMRGLLVIGPDENGDLPEGDLTVDMDPATRKSMVILTTDADKYTFTERGLHVDYAPRNGA